MIGLLSITVIRIALKFMEVFYKRWTSIYGSSVSFSLFSKEPELFKLLHAGQELLRDLEWYAARLRLRTTALDLEFSRRCHRLMWIIIRIFVDPGMMFVALTHFLDACLRFFFFSACLPLPPVLTFLFLFSLNSLLPLSSSHIVTPCFSLCYSDLFDFFPTSSLPSLAFS